MKVLKMDTLQKQQEDLSNTTDNKELTFELEPVEGTPFAIVRADEELYFGVIGNHKITTDYNSKEELKEELTKITWDRLVQVIWAVAEKFEKINKLTENE